LDVVLNTLQSYLSGFTGWGGAAFAVSTGLAGVLTWFNVKRVNQEWVEETEKLIQEADRITNSLVTRINEAGRSLTEEPSSREKDIGNQFRAVESEIESVSREINGFGSEVEEVAEERKVHLFQGTVSLENSKVLYGLADMQRRAIEEVLGLLREAGRLDENDNLVDVDGLDPELVGKLERSLADGSEIIEGLKGRIEGIRNETEGITDSESPASGRTGESSTGALPAAGSTDIPGQLQLPLGNRSPDSRQPVRPARQTRSQQPQQRGRGRT
jgi:archaellum component FlaC